MKIRDLIQRGRELYVQCHGHHPGIVSAPRRVPLDLSQFDPDTDICPSSGFSGQLMV